MLRREAIEDHVYERLYIVAEREHCLGIHIYRAWCVYVQRIFLALGILDNEQPLVDKNGYGTTGLAYGVTMLLPKMVTI
jgi:hypothetical protein